MTTTDYERWLAEPISYRQYLAEQTMLREEVTWTQAMEAVTTTLIAHPEVDGDQMRPRREWTPR